MNKRKAPKPEEAQVFIGTYFGTHRRVPTAREMRTAFGDQGSLETYAAMLKQYSDLSDANPTYPNQVRAPDKWDEAADFMRNWHEAEVRARLFRLEVACLTAERERDEARYQLERLRAGCKQSCRPVTFAWDEDDRNARAIDGSITLSVEEMEAIAKSLDDDEIPF